MASNAVIFGGCPAGEERLNGFLPSRVGVLADVRIFGALAFLGRDVGYTVLFWNRLADVRDFGSHLAVLKIFVGADESALAVLVGGE